jgi:hypothetical protein
MAVDGATQASALAVLTGVLPRASRAPVEP